MTSMLENFTGSVTSKQALWLSLKIQMDTSLVVSPQFHGVQREFSKLTVQLFRSALLIRVTFRWSWKSNHLKMLCTTLQGPTFGSGHDLYVSSPSNTNRNSCIQLNSYEFPNGISITEGGKFIVRGSDLKFQTLEIDVFQILNFYH